MGFTVIRPGGMNSIEYTVYVQVLRKHGFDLTNLRRVLDPETGWRLLPVWEHRADAEKFAAELRKRPPRATWEVHELTRKDAVSEGPLGPIIVKVGREWDGWIFEVDPLSRSMMKCLFPDCCPIDSLLIGKRRNGAAELDPLPPADVLGQGIRMLTGLTAEQMKVFGGYQVYDTDRQEALLDLKPLPNAR